MSLSTLRHLGWQWKTKNQYCLNGASAFVCDGTIAQVWGDELCLDGSLVFRPNQPISLDRRELFSGLMLPVPDKDDILGPKVAPQTLVFADVGITIDFQGDEVLLVNIQRAVNFDPDNVMACTISKPYCISGKLTSVIEFIQKRPVATKSHNFLSIQGVSPKMKTVDVLGAGWRSIGLLRYKEGTCRLYSSPDGESFAEIKHGRVGSVSGKKLLSPQGEVIIQRGQTVSTDRREVFNALSLPLSEGRPWEPDYEPPVWVTFIDWGLTAIVTDHIYQFQLSRTPSGLPAGISKGKYTISTPPTSPKVREILFCRHGVA